MVKGSDERKKRTRQHVIADLAVNHIERQVLLCGHTLQRIHHDYGLDGMLSTFGSRGQAENGLVWMQIKATDHLERLKRKGRSLGTRRAPGLALLDGRVVPCHRGRV